MSAKPGDGLLVEWEQGRVKFVSNEMRRDLAGRCLEGQPFGFTWEDVEVLLAAVVASPLNENARFVAESAIDRIAALLPPREGA
jgi:hypothetical protein